MPQRSRIVIGLNSGTSADGVDAAACEITDRGEQMKVKFLGQSRRKYPDGLRRRILDIMAPAQTRTEEVCRLNTEIGAVFAEAAAAVKRRLGLKRVDVIGSHGQTVCHLPPGGSLTGKAAAGTLQIGDAAVIAARMGVPVVHGFRQADMAAGGQGAPLVPWTDWVLFRHPKKNRILLNIGGIANLTWLPAGGGLDKVMAFDCGPGNMVIDALVRHFTKGKKQFDRGGRIAAKGLMVGALSDAMNDHPFHGREPPKSCGREDFGESWVRMLLKRFAGKKISSEDWIYTATWTTAQYFHTALYFRSNAFTKRGRIAEFIACGGGSHNATLLGIINRLLNWNPKTPPVAIRSTDDFGIPVDAKECVSFAMMAAARMDGVAANLPQVTGAKRRVVLGSVAE